MNLPREIGPNRLTMASTTCLSRWAFPLTCLITGFLSKLAGEGNARQDIFSVFGKNALDAISAGAYAETTALQPMTAHLRRVLSLWDLILYGIVLVQPIAPIPLFGLAQQLSHGHAAMTILLAMAAMVLTAISYGKMAAIYPSAGSAYTYVGRSLNRHAGFLIGWAMFLDYLLVPLICTIYAAVTLGRLFPAFPYFGWVLLFSAGMTLINLRGIRFTARASTVLCAVMTAVILYSSGSRLPI